MGLITQSKAHGRCNPDAPRTTIGVIALVAQSEERLSCKQRVGGSIPSKGSSCRAVS